MLLKEKTMKQIELADKAKIQDTYGIYKHCMYIPSEEKFAKKIG